MYITSLARRMINSLFNTSIQLISIHKSLKVLCELHLRTCNCTQYRHIQCWTSLSFEVETTRNDEAEGKKTRMTIRIKYSKADNSSTITSLL